MHRAVTAASGADTPNENSADLCDNNFPRLSQPVAAVDALLLRGRVPRLKHTFDYFTSLCISRFSSFIFSRHRDLNNGHWLQKIHFFKKRISFTFPVF